MDSGLVKIGLNYTRRKRKWIILLGLIGFSSYGLFKMYHMPSVARKRKRIMKILGCVFSLYEMVSDSAETITLVSRDLKEFLKSDSDEIPNSLRQLSKIARSQEVSESVIRVSQAMTVGILRGHKVEYSSTEIQGMDKFNLADRIMDKMMSKAGTGFVSVIVGSFAKNLVSGLYINSGFSGGLGESGDLNAPYMKSSSGMSSRWLDLLLDDKCRGLLADCIRMFVGTAVAVYLDKTMDVNFYDEMFSGLTNPKHRNDTRDIMVSLCNGMVETLVKTSHQVLTASRTGPTTLGSIDSCSIVEHSDVSSLKNKTDFEAREVKGVNRSVALRNSGWLNSVSATLAVPSNRKFVVDVTGRVTLETVRSVFEFFLRGIVECLRRSVSVVHSEVVERGYEVVRYFGSKSSVILTLCLMLLLHVVESTRFLLPAYNKQLMIS